MRRRVSLLSIALLSQVAFAGGGPENTLVVVNSRSAVSRRIADAYARLRDIPTSNVLSIDGVPHIGVISREQFLETIWKPIEARLATLGPIRLITYSADFPYGVRFQRFENAQERRVIGGIASLNGVTFLIKHVKAGEEFWNLSINPYYGIVSKARAANRRASPAETAHYQRAMAALNRKDYAKASEGFAKLLATYQVAPAPFYNYACCLARLGRADEAMAALRRAAGLGWNDAAHVTRDPDLASLRARPEFAQLVAGMGAALLPSKAFDMDGMYLSTHLAYTGPYGNSVPEALAVLSSAASADGTAPDGTVYFLKNKDVRSTTREPFLGLLRDGLKKRGRKFQLLDGVLPTDKADVFGAVVGSAKFLWQESGSTILPGAIVEHLTSHGANFGTPGQTKLSEFLRYGAAGASGTVMEPLALAQKFPTPLIHLFYADGCSLAEAFFRSVHGPYQLMIVGDGLCRPFAKFRDVTMVDGKPACGGPGAVRFEYWVDGKRVEALPRQRSRDVRVVAIHEPVDTRSYLKLSGDAPSQDPSPDFRPGKQIEMLPLPNGAREGYFFVARRGRYQLYLSGNGHVTIDGILKRTALVRQVYVPLDLGKGWHPIAIRHEPPRKGKQKLVVGLGGEQVYAPLQMGRVPPPPLKRQPKVDGDLTQGIVLSWKGVTKNIASITLHVGKGSAKDWVIERRVGARWKAVSDVAVSVGRGVVELKFGKPLRARRLRLRAAGDLVVARLTVCDRPR